MQNMINFNIRRLSYKNNFFSEKSKEYLMLEDNKNYNLIIIIFSEKNKNDENSYQDNKFNYSKKYIKNKIVSLKTIRESITKNCVVLKTPDYTFGYLQNNFN